MSPLVPLADLLSRSIPGNRLADYDGQRQVFAADGLRWLCSPPGAVQSAIRTDDPGCPVLPNHVAMALAAALPPRVERILDLGTGCGALLRFARARFTGARLTGVEQDPQMLNIARTHFALPADEAVVVASARHHLQRCTDKHDLIFVDLFDGLREPDWLLGEDFCAALAMALTHRGVAALNLLPTNASRLESQLYTARHHFRGAGLLRPPGQDNLVLVLSPVALDATFWETQLRAQGFYDRSAAAIFPSLSMLA